ncbi:MAG: 3D domain-containing protein [Candidatus Moranbacteria bacterium]|nr:3D domain-containing protein [Candidatus Moranbacteria bacterium]
MSYRKELLFVAVLGIGLFVTNIGTVAAENVELPLIQSYNYSQDPYLLEWSLKNKQIDTQIEQKELSIEDKILLKWKTKQASLWASLPTESFTINASAYTAAADECGKSDGMTASGLMVTEKRTLACPREFPFGTKISIEGMGEYRCEDRGGAIKGNHFDIYVKTKSQAFAFGRQNLSAKVIQ